MGPIAERRRRRFLARGERKHVYVRPIVGHDHVATGNGEDESRIARLTERTGSPDSLERGAVVPANVSPGLCVAGRLKQISRACPVHGSKLMKCEDEDAKKY